MIYLHWTRFRCWKMGQQQKHWQQKAAAAACVWYDMARFVFRQIRHHFGFFLLQFESHRVRRYDSWIRCYQIEMTHRNVLCLSSSFSLFGYNSHSFTLCLSLFSSWWRSLYAYIHNHERATLGRMFSARTYTNTRDTQWTHTSTQTQTDMYGRDWHFTKSTQFLYNSVVCVRMCVYACLLLIRSFSLPLHHHHHQKNRSFFHIFSSTHTQMCSHSILINFFSVLSISQNFNIFFHGTLENFQLTSIRFNSIYRFRGFAVKKWKRGRH